MSLAVLLQLIGCILTSILTAISSFHVVKTHSKHKKRLSRKEKKQIIEAYDKAKGQ